MEAAGWAPPRERAKIGKAALLWIVLSRGLDGMSSARPDKAYVIGAGLAGLAAAVRLVEAGSRSSSARRPRPVAVAAPISTPSLADHRQRQPPGAVGQPGGEAIPRHESAPRTSWSVRPRRGSVFADVGTGERWTIRPSGRRPAWWIFSPERRVPVQRPPTIWVWRACSIGRRQAVDQAIRASGPVWDRLMAPFLLAALNTDPAAGSAAWPRRGARNPGQGGRFYQPRIAHPTLSAAFVDPAADLSYPPRWGLAPGRRLRGMDFEGARVTP